ncbi:dihydrodipicolinate synthase family protein [Microbacterium lacticum]
MATPFDADGDIDVAALRDEVDWLFDNGADGITIAMVSEIQRLTPTERVELTAAVTAAVRHRGPVVASVGAESTRIARRARRRHDLVRSGRTDGRSAAADSGERARVGLPRRRDRLRHDPAPRGAGCLRLRRRAHRRASTG